MGETLIEALKREIFEEIGIIINEKSIRPFGIYSGDKCLTKYPNGDICHFVAVIFYTKINSNTKVISDEESEFLEYFSRDRLPLEKLKESDSIWITKWKNKDFQAIID